MTRRPFPVAHRPVHAAVLGAALLIAACGGGPNAPELTDPTEILTATANLATAARSVHVDLTADGELSLDLTGAGTATPVQLTDTTAAADLDITGGDARVTFAIPGVLGLRGELIAIDGTGYVKSTLTGARYRTVALGPAAPGDSSASMIAGLTDFLKRPGLEPVKGADVACGGGTCYTVTIDLTADELAALGVDTAQIQIPSGLPIPIPSLAGASVNLTVRVAKDTTRLAGLTAVVKTGDTGEATVTVTFSKWNDPITVSAPPADQVDGG